MSNNFVPMNMIPFIANMSNASKVKSEPSPEPQPFNPRKFFEKVVTLDLGEAKKEDGREVYTLWGIDGEQFTSLTTFFPPNVPAFKLKFEGKDYIIVSYIPVNENNIEELVDIDMDDASMTEHQTFRYISKETDAETGDSIFILQPK